MVDQHIQWITRKLRQGSFGSETSQFRIHMMPKLTDIQESKVSVKRLRSATRGDLTRVDELQCVSKTDLTDPKSTRCFSQLPSFSS